MIAFLSYQDIPDLQAVVVESSRVLAPQGRLVLAVTHPLNTAGVFGPGPCERDQPFVISGSWFERRVLRREALRDGLAMTFEMEHRPLQTYTEALTAAGFLIERMTELGEPDPGSKWSRIPLFLHVRALRP